MTLKANCKSLATLEAFSCRFSLQPVFQFISYGDLKKLHNRSLFFFKRNTYHNRFVREKKKQEKLSMWPGPNWCESKKYTDVILLEYAGWTYSLIVVIIVAEMSATKRVVRKTLIWAQKRTSSRRCPAFGRKGSKDSCSYIFFVSSVVAHLFLLIETNI